MTDPLRVSGRAGRLADAPVDRRSGLRSRIDKMNDRAWSLVDSDMSRALALAEKALALSQGSEGGIDPYPTGTAYSLRTQGYLNQRLGHYAQGLEQLLASRRTSEELQLGDCLADVLDGMAGIHMQMGLYDEALSIAYQQLDAARRVGDGKRRANARNNIAAIYFETGDKTAALELFERNLSYAIDAGDRRMAYLSHVNLAETQLVLGDHASALANGRRALQAAREHGFPLFEVYALDLLGTYHMTVGRTAEAVRWREEALALSRNLQSKATEVLALLHLGETYLDLEKPDLAIAYLEEGERAAQEIASQSDLARAHLLLTRAHECRGAHALALEHLRRHMDLRESIAGDKAEQRIQVLRITHDRETERRAAVTAERQRLARDLHDSVTQSLYSLTLFSRSGREAAEDGDRERLERCLDDLERNSLLALREMRLLLFELGPMDLEAESLIQALQNRLSAVERRSGFQIDLEIQEVPGLSPGQQAEIYSLIIEALNNVVKHAAARRVRVQLVPTSEGIELRVTDDGVGFDPVSARGGHGMRTMGERAAALGGRLTVTSAPGAGTCVEAVIPHAGKEEL